MTTLATVAFAFAMLSAIGIVVLFVVATAAADAEEVLPHAKQCAWCKKYGNENDEWLAENGALTSHGICEDCRRKAIDEVV